MILFFDAGKPSALLSHQLDTKIRIAHNKVFIELSLITSMFAALVVVGKLETKTSNEYSSHFSCIWLRSIELKEGIRGLIKTKVFIFCTISFVPLF